MDRICGPYKGYYIAAYTVAAGSSFTGYAKVCAHQPADVWKAEPAERLVSVTGMRSEAEALAAVEQKARRAIADMVGEPITTPGALE